MQRQIFENKSNYTMAENTYPPYKADYSCLVARFLRNALSAGDIDHRFFHAIMRGVANGLVDGNSLYDLCMMVDMDHHTYHYKSIRGIGEKGLNTLRQLLNNVNVYLPELSFGNKDSQSSLSDNQEAQMGTNWTVFQPATNRMSVYGPYQDTLAIFVNVRGEISLSRAAFDAIGKPTHVVMLSDGNGNIGIQAADASNPYRYKIAGGDPKKERRISCKAFTDMLKLKFETPHAFLASVENGNTIVVNLRRGPISLKG